MRILLFEVPSIRGYVNVVELQGVLSAKRVDDITIPKLGNNKLFCKVQLEGNKPYILSYFTDEPALEQVIKLINSDRAHIYLEYEKYFVPTYLSNNLAYRLINTSLDKYISYAINYLTRKNINWKQTDAFRIIVDMDEFLNSPIDDSWIAIWAKTLPMPESMAEAGVTKMQFFTRLIDEHNKKFINPNNIYSL